MSSNPSPERPSLIERLRRVANAVDHNRTVGGGIYKLDDLDAVTDILREAADALHRAEQAEQARDDIKRRWEADMDAGGADLYRRIKELQAKLTEVEATIARWTKERATLLSAGRFWRPE